MRHEIEALRKLTRSMWLTLTVTVAFFAAKALAFPVPSYLKDGTITVKLKDGTEHTYSSNEYKVVKRTKKLHYSEPKRTEVAVSQSSITESRKNRFTLLGGIGQSGYKIDTFPGLVKVHTKTEFVYGGAYTRDISERFHLNGTVLSNDTYILGLGVQW